MIFKAFKTFRNICYSLLGWGYIILAFFTHNILTRILLLTGQHTQEKNHFLGADFLRPGFRLFGVKIQIINPENIPKKDRFILMANHESILDIALLICFIPRKLSFIAKKELLKVPFLGFAMRNQGQITIDRQNARSASKTMSVVKEAVLKKNASLFIFPEGTRSSTGQIGNFKRGGFQIAVETDTPIIPCRIKGAFKVLSKNSWIITPGTISITFGKKIDIPKGNSPSKEKAQHLLTTCEDIIKSL